MRHRRTVVLLGIVALLAGAVPCAGALRLDEVQGHLAIGFGHLATSDTSATPTGSLSIGGGVDVPVARRLRAGIDAGYHLLGSRTLVQGTLSSGIDYSVFEALALLHWMPLDRGPQLIVSGGPGLFVARASLAASSVGAAFVSQTVDQTQLGGALSLSAIRRPPASVRIGIELGVRVVPLASTTWTLASARVTMHY